MTDTRWVTTTLAETPGQVTSVPILPIGSFKLPNHSRRKDGKLDITPEMADELVANFEARVLKTDIRFDIEHDFREAAAWIVGLSVGTFPHAVTGEDMPGLIAEVEWTPTGVQALADKTYRYVSAAFGPYEDEETGTKYANVLKAVALTNDPAMKMLPAVTLSDPELSHAPVVSLAVVEADPVDKWRSAVQAAVNDAYPSENPGMDTWVSEYVEGGVIVSHGSFGEGAYMFIPVANEGGVPSLGTPTAATRQWSVGDTPLAVDTAMFADEPEDILSRFDALMEECEAVVKGTAGVREMRALAKATRSRLDNIITRKGGTTMTEGITEDVHLTEENARLKAENDALATKVAETAKAERVRRATEVCDAMSAKGWDEVSRNRLFAILTADGDVLLSDGGTETTLPEAVAELAEGLAIVPVKEEKAGEQPAPEDGAVALTEEAKHIAKLLDVDTSKLTA